MTSTIARTLNAVFVLVVCGILLGAFTVQVAAGELPCPLCLLQRLAMLGVGFGAVLNVEHGSRPRHYGVSLLSAVFGGAAAGRQVLLHIAPGDAGYGSAFFGLHLYTWSFLAFVGTGVVLAAMLFFDSQFATGVAAQSVSAENDSAGSGSRIKVGTFARFAVLLLITLAAANFVCTLLLCGAGPCDGNPTRYELLSR